MADESTSSVQKIWHKAFAGFFAAVVAPVLVAFGIKFSDKVMTAPEAKPAAAAAPVAGATPVTTVAGAAPAVAPGVVATATPAATAAPLAANPVAAAPAATAPLAAAPVAPPATPPVAAAPAASSSAIALAATASTPPAATSPVGAQPPVALPTFKKPQSQPERLFNGRDLTGFYTYLGRPHRKAKPYGKDNDPDKVFSVQNGTLRISGETLGVLETEKSYNDYWLTLEYKWGDKTWPADSNDARRSAVLLNIEGPDGAVRGASPCSFHVQLLEGATGDFLVSAGTGEQHYSLTAAVQEMQVHDHAVAFYTPGAPKTTFTQGVIKRYPPGPAWRDTKGYHPEGDLEHPAGEWNTLDCVVLNGKIWVRLNDHVVNFAYTTTPAGGRIALQSHGAEVYFRNITLQPYLKHHEQSAERESKGGREQASR